MINLIVTFWFSASTLFFLSKLYVSRPKVTIIGLNTSLILYLASAAMVFYYGHDLTLLLLGLIALFMALTVLRILVDNYKNQHFRSYADMVLLHFVLVIVLAGLWMPINFQSANLFEVIRIISLSFSVLVFFSVIYNSFKYRYKKTNVDNSFSPSVSLLIPARNERHALEDALRAALAIDYDKLEIIVMDDASQDNTPEIIKSFAHDGIRFIEGGDLPKGWIGKNYALQRLAKEASGSILVFCDVDTRLEPQTLKRLISKFQDSSVSMVSVFPKRHHVNYAHLFVQTLESLRKLATPYWAIPRLNPASSACWALRKSTLRRLHDFELARSNLAPHYFFSKRLSASQQRFYFANFSLPVSIRKRLSSEVESRVRRFYPGAGGSFVHVFFLSLFTLFVLFPFVDLIVNFSGVYYDTFSILAVGLYLSSHLVALTKVAPSTWYMGIINFIPSVLMELVILYISFVKYEFGSVQWKNRTLPTDNVLQASDSQ